jgi:hypothetical protein
MTCSVQCSQKHRERNSADVKLQNAKLQIKATRRMDDLIEEWDADKAYKVAKTKDVRLWIELQIGLNL